MFFEVINIAMTASSELMPAPVDVIVSQRAAGPFSFIALAGLAGALLVKLIPKHWIQKRESKKKAEMDEQGDR